MTGWWPKLPPQVIDPFDEAERDQILEYYLDHRPYWEYAFVYFRFWTGTRPGEATGLKLGTVNLKTRKAHIVTSRYMNEDGLPKTGPSERNIDLSLGVTAILKKIWPLRADPKTYLFRDGEGKPIDQSEFNRKSFQPVLRILKVRPRDFYNTRHTFISVILTYHPEKLKWLSEQVGTSMDMIQNDYGKDLNNQGATQLDALEKKRDSRRDPLEEVA
jgi:integrase